MRRSSFIALLLVLLALAETSSAGELDVPFHRQNTQMWCWAASIAMVSEYFTGRPIEDCEVLSLYDRALQGPGTCCMGDSRCMRGSMPNEIGPILTNIFGLRVQTLSRGLSWQELVSNIDNGKPVIAWVWNSPSSAHVMVLVGYDEYGSVIVLDPMAGRKSYPFSGFAANWGPAHDWNISWVFGGASAQRNCSTVVDACSHPMHSYDATACVHGTQHPYDSGQCGHLCGYDYWGRPVPCHSYDTYPCSHPMHPYGDQMACSHPAHPGGHSRQVCD
jgi:predicted double-glycine peptidase